MIIRSDSDGGKKHQALVSIIHAYFVRETYNTFIHYSHSWPFNKNSTALLSEPSDFGLPDTGTVNPVSSNHHHTQEKSFAIVPLHPFTHGAPEYRGHMALPMLSVQVP